MVSSRAPVVEVSPSEPASAVLQQALSVLSAGGVIAFPTDTLYGLGCALGQPQAIERIQRMRGLDLATRPLTFLLPDLGELPRFTRVSESAYRVLNRIFPGPYCTELLAHPRVPSPLVHDERFTIGVRIPHSALCEKLTWRLGRPILTATAKSRDGHVLSSAAEIRQEYGTELDLILDGGALNGPPSTVVSLVDDWVTVLREGLGPVNRLFGVTKSSQPRAGQAAHPDAQAASPPAQA
ncbi:MAG: L-threonylcarbamoyladenylate synthase [Polyangia bacterium]